MQRKHRRILKTKLLTLCDQTLFEEACSEAQWLKYIAPKVLDAGKKAPVKRHRVTLALTQAELARRS